MAKTAEFLPARNGDDVDEFEVIPPSEPRIQTAHDDALIDFLESSKQAGGDAYLIIRKLNDPTNPNSQTIYCARIPVDKYDYWELHDYIRRNWGGGDYRVYCSAIVNGKRQQVQNQLLSIASPVEKPVNSEQSEIVSLLREVLNRQQQAPAAQTSSMVSQMRELAELMAILQPKQPANPMMEFITTMRGFQELGFIPGGGTNQPDDDNNEMWRALGKAVPALVQGVLQSSRPVVARPNPAPRAKPTGPAPVKPATAEKVVNPQPEPKKEEPADMVKMYLNQLLPHANVTAPRAIAEHIQANTDDATWDMLIGVVEDDDFVDKYASGAWIIPENKEWLADVREWLLAFAGLPSAHSETLDAEEADEIDAGAIDLPDDEGGDDAAGD